MINAGQVGNTVVIKLQPLINLEIKFVCTVEELAFFADFIAAFHR